MNFKRFNIQLVIAVVALFVLGVLPIITVMIFALFGAAWDLTYGVTGLMNFGPGVAFGVGAFALNYFARADISPPLALILGASIAGASGTIMWIPSVRMSGAYLAIVTLAILLLAGDVALVQTGEEGLSNGMTYFAVSINTAYYGALVVSMAGIFVLLFIKGTKFGLRLRAIKDDEISAKSIAINTTRYKLAVFIASSFFLGLAGAYYSLYSTSVNYGIFSITNNFLGVAVGVIGGPGTIVGSILGSLIVEIPSGYLVSYGPYSLIVYGLTMVIVMLFLRGGLMQIVSFVVRKVRYRK
ncbi:MAG: branched-chain amino acid ABC transporter permease [Nitrososphaerota archaeon]|nr:branched-chain amino acid ABC transporter permease [Nitrososphaerota archaeon]